MRYLFILITGFLLASCSPKEPLYNTQSYVFGTLVDITIYGEPEQEAQIATMDITRMFQDLHNRLHAWRQSDIKALNHSFSLGKIPKAITPDVEKIIKDATELSIQSNGSFNPAIGKLINLWGFQNDEFQPIKIDHEKIEALVNANPQMTDITIEDGSAYSNNPAVQLDFGGYAKGYALDLALEYFHTHGIKNALVNIGGNIIAIGKHGNKPWRVGIQHPRQPNAIAALDLPSEWAIGTSGDYQRYFEQNGQRYCHIIDPATGYPATGVQSVTVLIPPQNRAGVMSDVASKPIFIAKAGARTLAAKAMNVDDYLIIASEKDVQISPSMAKKITWLDPKIAKLAVIAH